MVGRDEKVFARVAVVDSVGWVVGWGWVGWGGDDLVGDGVDGVDDEHGWGWLRGWSWSGGAGTGSGIGGDWFVVWVLGGVERGRWAVFLLDFQELFFVSVVAHG